MENYKKQIPIFRDKEGRLWYDCSVGVAPGKEDHVDFSDISSLLITGDLYLGDDASLGEGVLIGGTFVAGNDLCAGVVETGGPAIIGHEAEVDVLLSASDIITGDFLKSGSIASLGSVTLGCYALVNGDVVSEAGITILDHTQIYGNVSTQDGSIQLSDHVSVAENVKSKGGNISIGHHCEVLIDVVSEKGNIAVGHDTFVHGKIATGSSGTLSLGNYAEASGSIFTECGDITCANHVDVEEISSTSGTITIGVYLTASNVSTGTSIHCKMPISKVYKFTAPGGVYMS